MYFTRKCICITEPLQTETPSFLFSLFLSSVILRLMIWSGHVQRRDYVVNYTIKDLPVVQRTVGVDVTSSDEIKKLSAERETPSNVHTSSTQVPL